MMNPEPMAQHRWLHQLLGDWTCESTADMGPDAPPMQGTGTEHVRALGGLWVLGEGTGTMPGNIAYLIGEDSANADAIWIVELWDSKESHARSLQLPAVQAAIKKVRPLIAGFGTRAEFKPVAKTGV